MIEDCIAEWMQTLKEGDVAIFSAPATARSMTAEVTILPSSDEPHEEDPEAHAKELKKDAIDAEATLNEILRPKLRTHSHISSRQKVRHQRLPSCSPIFADGATSLKAANLEAEAWAVQ